MARERRVTVGYWWRFAKYDLRDGYLRPARGARLEQYDPFESAVYESLVELVGSKGIFPITPEGERRVLAWVADHGLLGILPHETLSATLTPQWQPFFVPGNDELFATVPRYIRTPTGWSVRGHVPMRPSATKINEPKFQGELVDGKTIAEMVRQGAEIPPAGVIRQPIGHPEVRQESLAVAWGNFFPDVPPEARETFKYPLPLSAEFWRAYAEPVDLFLHAAVDLRRSLTDLQPLTAEMTRQDRVRVQSGARDLAELLGPVTPVPMIDDRAGKVRLRWASTSLLATAAMQALIALSGEGRVLVCVCGKVSISDDSRARYCSEKCRARARMRRYRSKRKA
jgi:hypothetical protein